MWSGRWSGVSEWCALLLPTAPVDCPYCTALHCTALAYCNTVGRLTDSLLIIDYRYITSIEVLLGTRLDWPQRLAGLPGRVQQQRQPVSHVSRVSAAKKTTVRNARFKRRIGRQGCLPAPGLGRPGRPDVCCWGVGWRGGAGAAPRMANSNPVPDPDALRVPLRGFAVTRPRTTRKHGVKK